MRVTKRTVFPLLTFLVCIVLTLGAIESTLRIFPPPWLQVRMKILTAGHAYHFGSDQGWPVVRENGKFKSFTPNSTFAVRHYEYDTQATIDELGGRLVANSEAGGRIVPFMGDSFTFGVGVEDKETFVSLLSGRPGTRLVNLGVPGTALSNQLEIVRMRHDALGNPRSYVFVFFLGNDFHDMYNSCINSDLRDVLNHDASDKSDRWSNNATRGALWHVNDFVYHSSWLKRVYTIQFVRKMVLDAANSSGDRYIDPIFENMDKRSRFLKRARPCVSGFLHRLRSLSEALRFDPIFIFLPDRAQVKAGLRKTLAKYYNIPFSRLNPNRPNTFLASEIQRIWQGKIYDITKCIRKALHEGNAPVYYVQDNKASTP